MATLGDFLPADWRESLANNNLKEGAVIRILVPDTTPPKTKLLIIISIEESRVLLASIFINTDINPNVLNTPDLESLQFPLLVERNQFLSHDSYADCSKITPRTYETVFNAVKNEPACHLGQLHDADFNSIRLLIKSTKTIPVRIKKQFGLFL